MTPAECKLFGERLLAACGLIAHCQAKYRQKEHTTSLSRLEEKIRIQLSWQSFDFAGSAPGETLKEEGVVNVVKRSLSGFLA